MSSQDDKTVRPGDLTSHPENVSESFEHLSVSSSHSTVPHQPYIRHHASTISGQIPVNGAETHTRPPIPVTHSASAIHHHLQQRQQQFVPKASPPLSAPLPVGHQHFQQNLAPATSPYTGLSGQLPANVQARLQAFQQSRQRSNSASNTNHPVMSSITSSPSASNIQHQFQHVQPHMSPRVGGFTPDLSRSPSSGSTSSYAMQSHTDSCATSPVVSPLTDGISNSSIQTVSEQQVSNDEATTLSSLNYAATAPAGPVPPGSNTPRALGALATTRGAAPSIANTASATAAVSATAANQTFSGALSFTPNATQLKGSKPSLSARRNIPKLSTDSLFNNSSNGGANGMPDALASGSKSDSSVVQPNRRPMKLPNMSKPRGGIFTEYSRYIDISGGKLNFAGKASLHSRGIEFGTGLKKKVYSISLDEFESLGELGKGNYGTVTKVMHKPTGVVMAMKEIRLELEEAKFAQIIMELEVLHNCQSPYIVDFYGAFFAEGAVYVCMEFMDGGSLDKIYQGGVAEPELAVITKAVVEGLRELKDKHNIIHRDVKPTNILVSSAGKVKLCDFGVSGRLVQSIARTNIGCQSYMAPERIKSATPASEYTVHSDVWSLGLSILEIAQGSYPYPPETYNNIFSQLSAIVDGQPPSLSDEYSEEAKSFVRQCLNKVPSLRPPYAKLLQHPWMSKYKTEDVELGKFVKDALERRALGITRDAPRPALHNGGAVTDSIAEE